MSQVSCPAPDLSPQYPLPPSGLHRANLVGSRTLLLTADPVRSQGQRVSMLWGNTECNLCFLAEAKGKGLQVFQLLTQGQV